MYNEPRLPEAGFVPKLKIFALVNIHRALARDSCFFKFCTGYSRKNSSFFSILRLICFKYRFRQ